MLTFIIPSINRPTLKRTLESILKQTDPDWKAIVVFDGTNSKLPITDPRIKVINIPKTGKLNHGGAVRNVGIAQVSQDSGESCEAKFEGCEATRVGVARPDEVPWTSGESLRDSGVTNSWIGFVDDDDTISPDYITKFKEELNLKPELGVIVFRMVQNQNTVLPPINATDLIRGKVGISFCVKSEILNKFKFNPSNAEDFELLNTLKINKIPIVISKYITYFVRNCKLTTNIDLERYYINL